MTEHSLNISSLRRQFAHLVQVRRPWEKQWQMIRRYVLPNIEDFAGKISVDQKTTHPILYDGTAPLALERFAALLDSLLTPATGHWHGIRLRDDNLNQLPEVKHWCEQVTQLLFNIRYRPAANFASQQHEHYVSLGAFGTSVMLIDEAENGQICYRAIPLTQIYLSQNAHGRIDTVFRQLDINLRSATEIWPQTLPTDYYKRAVEQPEEMITIIHAVFPANTHLSASHITYQSVYFCAQQDHIIEEGFYRTFPYVISRYLTIAGEVYGRSPAMSVLADIKMLNEMEKTQLRVIHQQLVPPVFVPEEGFSQPITLSPGAINYGGVDGQGRLLIQALPTSSHIGISESKMEQKRQMIREAFLVNLANMLDDHPNMTATEVLQRAQEKGLLLAPLVGRQQSESLEPLIERELDILYTQGLIPPLPIAIPYHMSLCQILYDSPINRLQRTEHALGLLRLLESITSFTNQDPTILGLFNVPAIIQELASIYSVPTTMLN